MTNIITREQGNLYIVLHALLASSKYTTTHLLRKYDKNYTYFKPCIHEEHNTPSGYGWLSSTCFNPRAREERDHPESFRLILIAIYWKFIERKIMSIDHAVANW